jgi:16S rRNA (guanine1207-N2)-methyltransferase
MGGDGGRAKPGAGRRGDEAGEYHRWVTLRLQAGGRELEVATKPGVPGHEGLAAATGLLLDHVDHLALEPGGSLLDLHCGRGEVGALAASLHPGLRVRAFDRNLAATEAARRTLAANGVADAEATHAAGPDPGDPARFDAATVRLPQGRIPTLHQIRAAFHALRPGGICLLAGANDEGIRTALRQMGEVFGEVEVLGYRGGSRVGLAVRPAGDLAEPFEWLDPERFHRFTIDAPDGPLTVLSRPGVFSWDRLDAGSRALLETMEIAPDDDVLDLGCGYGPVGLVAARRSISGRTVLVDVDSEAVRSARRSAAENGLAERVEVIASDAARTVHDRVFDVVLSNPPFHLEKGTNLDIPAQFIRDAAAVLRVGGCLYLVANRTLPYERWLEESFGAYQMVRDGREFKVLRALRAR